MKKPPGSLSKVGLEARMFINSLLLVYLGLINANFANYNGLGTAVSTLCLPDIIACNSLFLHTVSNQKLDLAITWEPCS